MRCLLLRAICSPLAAVIRLHRLHASSALMWPQDAPFGNPYRQSLQRLQDADDLGGCMPYGCMP